jgi:excisionase family DNA binding protein
MAVKPLKIATAPVRPVRIAPLKPVEHPTVETPWMTAVEASLYIRLSLSWVKKATAAGAIPVSRIGRRVLYSRESLDRFIQSQAAPAGGATNVVS